MAGVVNLRDARKRAARRRREERAAENRIIHGRPKAERVLNDARGAKAARDLEGHKIDPKDPQ